jgi:hypothetical protein
VGAYQDLFINQNETFSTDIVLQDVNGEAYNFLDYNAAAYAKRSYYQANASFVFVVSSTDPTNGVLTLSLDANTTSNITPQSYVFDIIIQDQYNTVAKVLEGRIFVAPGVTPLTAL